MELVTLCTCCLCSVVAGAVPAERRAVASRVFFQWGQREHVIELDHHLNQELDSSTPIDRPCLKCPAGGTVCDFFFAGGDGARVTVHVRPFVGHVRSLVSDVPARRAPASPRLQGLAALVCSL